MRMLWPHASDGELSDADLDRAYAWPDRPWLRANMVSTVDGSAHGEDGLSGGISSPADKRVFGVLRALSDVVLVGAGTVRAEGYRPPRPRAGYAERRAAAGQRAVPVIAVVSGSLDLDPALSLFADAAERPVVLTCTAADSGRRASLVRVADVIDCGETSVEPDRAVAALHDRGLSRVLTEGGPRLLGDLVAAELLDELCLTVSPCLVGASAGGGPGRILAAGALPSAMPLQLAHVFVDDGVLFLRYGTSRGTPP